MERKYFAGQTYSRLTTIRFHHKEKDNKYWLFACACGNETVQSVAHVSKGIIKSCGCYHREESASRAKEQFTKHGLCGTRLYSIWKSMKVRCLNPNSKSYKHYGERGIDILDRWKEDFMSFHDWAVESGYTDNLTLDRINNDGNYCPDNCRWATAEDQAYNKRTTAIYEYNGDSFTFRELLAFSCVPKKTLRDRLKSGWGIHRAISQQILV